MISHTIHAQKHLLSASVSLRNVWSIIFLSIVGMRYETSGSFQNDLFEHKIIVSSSWLVYFSPPNGVRRIGRNVGSSADQITYWKMTGLNGIRILIVKASPTLVATPVHHPKLC
jgi:hypothetical protein